MLYVFTADNLCSVPNVGVSALYGNLTKSYDHAKNLFCISLKISNPNMAFRSVHGILNSNSQ